jgi:hypothetical protein
MQRTPQLVIHSMPPDRSSTKRRQTVCSQYDAKPLDRSMQPDRSSALCRQTVLWLYAAMQTSLGPTL